MSTWSSNPWVLCSLWSLQGLSKPRTKCHGHAAHRSCAGRRKLWCPSDTNESLANIANSGRGLLRYSDSFLVPIPRKLPKSQRTNWHQNTTIREPFSTLSWAQRTSVRSWVRLTYLTSCNGGTRAAGLWLQNGILSKGHTGTDWWQQQAQSVGEPSYPLGKPHQHMQKSQVFGSTPIHRYSVKGRSFSASWSAEMNRKIFTCYKASKRLRPAERRYFMTVVQAFLLIQNQYYFFFF